MADALISRTNILEFQGGWKDVLICFAEVVEALRVADTMENDLASHFGGLLSRN